MFGRKRRALEAAHLAEIEDWVAEAKYLQKEVDDLFEVHERVSREAHMYKEAAGELRKINGDLKDERDGLLSFKHEVYKLNPGIYRKAVQRANLDH